MAATPSRPGREREELAPRPAASRSTAIGTPARRVRLALEARASSNPGRMTSRGERTRRRRRPRREDVPSRNSVRCRTRPAWRGTRRPPPRSPASPARAPSPAAETRRTRHHRQPRHTSAADSSRDERRNGYRTGTAEANPDWWKDTHRRWCRARPGRRVPAGACPPPVRVRVPAVPVPVPVPPLVAAGVGRAGVFGLAVVGGSSRFGGWRWRSGPGRGGRPGGGRRVPRHAGLVLHPHAVLEGYVLLFVSPLRAYVAAAGSSPGVAVAAASSASVPRVLAVPIAVDLLARRAWGKLLAFSAAPDRVAHPRQKLVLLRPPADHRAAVHRGRSGGAGASCFPRCTGVLRVPGCGRRGVRWPRFFGTARRRPVAGPGAAPVSDHRVLQRLARGVLRPAVSGPVLPFLFARWPCRAWARALRGHRVGAGAC